MYSNIDNKAKLNAFKPVQIPKVRDIFKRCGYRQMTPTSSQTAEYFSRNPLEQHDNFSKGFSQHLYDEYAREQAEIQSAIEDPKEDPKEE